MLRQLRLHRRTGGTASVVAARRAGDQSPESTAAKSLGPSLRPNPWPPKETRRHPATNPMIETVRRISHRDPPSKQSPPPHALGAWPVTTMMNDRTNATTEAAIR